MIAMGRRFTCVTTHDYGIPCIAGSRCVGLLVIYSLARRMLITSSEVMTPVSLL
jgi:hypothetical protein